MHGVQILIALLGTSRLDEATALLICVQRCLPAGHSTLQDYWLAARSVAPHKKTPGSRYLHHPGIWDVMVGAKQQGLQP